MGRRAAIRIVMKHQDDPKKCTAARLVRLGIASAVRRPADGYVVLHPYAPRMILPADGIRGCTICALDCSWRLASQEFDGYMRGHQRSLPPLLAGNPVNYSKLGMLSTVEAIAAALYITGFSDMADDMLGRFRWGHTFQELNEGLLQEYAACVKQDDILRVASSYGLPCGEQHMQ